MSDDEVLDVERDRHVAGVLLDDALCQLAGFELEPFQRRIAKAALGPERELLVLLPRGNGKSRLIGTLAVHHLLTIERPAVYVATSSRDQALGVVIPTGKPDPLSRFFVGHYRVVSAPVLKNRNSSRASALGERQLELSKGFFDEAHCRHGRYRDAHGLFSGDPG